MYTSGDYLPRLEDEHCPFPACPCDADGMARCESFREGTLVMPDGNTTLILVVRNPVEVVLSALFYHRPVRALHGGKLQYAICVWPQACLCRICVCRHASAVNAAQAGVYKCKLSLSTRVQAAAGT